VDKRDSRKFCPSGDISELTTVNVLHLSRRLVAIIYIHTYSEDQG